MTVVRWWVLVCPGTSRAELKEFKGKGRAFRGSYSNSARWVTREKKIQGEPV
jgi:hypothetical protein